MKAISKILATCGLALLFAGHGRAEENPKSVDRPVEQELKSLSGEFRKQSPEIFKTFDAGIEEVAASDVMKTALKMGDKAPAFELPDASGKLVKLDELLEKGPVVVTWYRGGWCPACNIGLRGLLRAEPQIREFGATLVAVSPQTPDSTAETVKKLDLKYEVLSDKGNAAARKYGIVYKIPAKPSAQMKAFQLDLAKINGDASDELPLGATYVIDRDRTIRWAFVDADYWKRAEPADVVAALKLLKK